MKFTTLLPLSILCLASCSKKAPEEEPAPAPKPKVKTEEAPPPPVQLPDAPADGISFSDPVTTGSLLNDDNKKTITGPIPSPAPIEGDHVINVTPPPLPTPSLPDE